MEQNQRATVEADVPPELAAQLVRGEITLAEFTGLSRTTLYAIAEHGYQMFSSGKLEEARTIYRGLVAADPFDSVFRCHLAAANHRLGELDEALNEYTMALRFNVSNVDALVGRGEIHLQRGQLAEALEDLTSAIKLDPQGHLTSTLRAGAILNALKQAAASPPTPSAGN
ncbi:MAG TPA: tetratricopeptide repeat protein [Pyrinomonadaceae bacterium]|jgi:tetratricopeptide (TPR) repeat protein